MADSVVQHGEFAQPSGLLFSLLCCCCCGLLFLLWWLLLLLWFWKFDCQACSAAIGWTPFTLILDPKDLDLDGASSRSSREQLAWYMVSTHCTSSFGTSLRTSYRTSAKRISQRIPLARRQRRLRSEARTCHGTFGTRIRVGCKIVSCVACLAFFWRMFV